MRSASAAARLLHDLAHVRFLFYTAAMAIEKGRGATLNGESRRFALPERQVDGDWLDMAEAMEIFQFEELFDWDELQGYNELEAEATDLTEADVGRRWRDAACRSDPTFTRASPGLRS